MNRPPSENGDGSSKWVAWILGLLFVVVAYLWSLIAPNWTRSPTSAQQTLALNYGARQPQFLACTFAQALQTAKEQHKFLLLYLHSKNHQDTPRFCREVLCTERVATFFEDNFVLWGGDVSTTPAFKLSTKYGTTNYPFIAVIANVTYNPSMVAFWQSLNYHPRITRSGEHLLYKKQGFISEDDLINSLGEILENHQALLHAAKSERESMERERQLRVTQDEEYNRTVQEDIEKEEKRRRELEEQEEERKEEERQKEEEEKKKEESKIRNEKHKQVKLVQQEKDIMMDKPLEEQPKRDLPAPPPEPPKGPSTTDIKIRLSDGSTTLRRFSNSDPIDSIFLFVATKESIENKVLTTTFPRKTFKFNESSCTLQEAGLSPQALLVLEEPIALPQNS